MVNTQLFHTIKGALLPDANAVNAQRAPAYALTPRHRLAQLAATGCLGQTFYASAEAQLDAVLALARNSTRPSSPRPRCTRARPAT